MRILIEKSIEEDIYRKNYNPDVVVSFEEQDYMVEPLKPKIVHPENDTIDVKKLKTKKKVEDVLNDINETKPKRVIKKKSPSEIDV